MTPIVKNQLKWDGRRIECEDDGMFFNRYFMKQRMGNKMIIGRHHSVMQSALDRTMLPPDHPDFISRLIINISPGYTKTEVATINYIARGLALNKRSRFFHISYSHKLALKNSSDARATVKSLDYQHMWPMRTRDDSDAKEAWWTTAGGGVYATSSKGQITGFRAGHMDHFESGFCGALLIDDPINPKIARSDTMRQQVNDDYNETIASRLAVESIPIIIIMQRIHWDDLSGFLLRGGSGEKWHHLSMPVKIDNSLTYPEEYTHGIQIPHGLDDGWLWPFKHNDEHEAALMASRRKFSAQYMQAPSKIDEERAYWTDGLLSRAKMDLCKDEPVRTVVAVDPATTANATSDMHGIVVASEYSKTSLQADADYSCKGSPKTWADRAIEAYKKHEADAIVIETNQGGDMCESTLRNSGYRGRVIRVHAMKGKTLRAEPVAALYEMGYVKHTPGLGKLEDEMVNFDPLTGKSNGVSPNRLDALVYAMTELSGGEESLDDLFRRAIGANKQ